MTVDGPAETAVGQEFDVTVRVATDIGISRLRGQVRFDSSALQLLSATAGDVVPSSAGSPTVDAKSGGAQMDVVASDDPIQGEGSLMLLHFKALAARPASAIAAQISAISTCGRGDGECSYRSRSPWPSNRDLRLPACARAGLH